MADSAEDAAARRKRIARERARQRAASYRQKLVTA